MDKDSYIKEGTAVIATKRLQRLCPGTVLGITTSNQRSPLYINVRPVGRKSSYSYFIRFWRPATITEIKELFL